MHATNRRELKTRKRAWVAYLTRRLVATNITPNQISLISMVCAVLSGLSFYSFSHQPHWVWLVLAAIFIQLRLLCNMMDGLVAVEGGKGTKSGELFNDIPDRFADIFILLGAGYAASSNWGAALGCSAAMLAVMTAYIRTLGGSLGAPISFMGPMAKQHRMGALTAISLLAIAETLLWNSHWLLLIGLLLIIAGTLWTCYRRAAAIYHFLEQQPDKQVDKQPNKQRGRENDVV
ncbi:MAG: CDP-diacylglycerol--glycerol-3-phosphate 3-phosphatidyltransferase [Gammaproteobacteria bacterium]|nr:MAG: CDP-diacylglycerol--glycerol-3-phosphate 3-phosphatidyltransferase [Gammaproteobacteria bacterium]